MASFNKVILLGNLTRDPELRVTANGNNICKITVAASRKFRGADGSDREETAFVDVVCFGGQAEVISKYFSKGKPILVEGRLRLDQWETPSGEKRSKLVVVLESFQFVGPKEFNSGGGYSSNESSSFNQPATASANQPSSSAAMESFNEDVPF